MLPSRRTDKSFAYIPLYSSLLYTSPLPIPVKFPEHRRLPTADKGDPYTGPLSIPVGFCCVTGD